MMWTNEREIPPQILGLLESPDLPDELRREITKAIDEIHSQGAVSYSAKARVEFYMNKYKDFLEARLNQSSE